MFKALILVLSLSVAIQAVQLDEFRYVDPTDAEMDELFGTYIMYQAPFPIEPTFERYEFFRAQVLDIIAHNRDTRNTWKKAITRYTGLTLKELEGVSIMAPQNCSATNQVSPRVEATPEQFDWRSWGAVSHVKDQGHCGSCWSFSTTGAVESNFAIANFFPPFPLSEQQLVDCAGDFNNHGCSGGLPSQAFEYIRAAGGIQDEWSYPYKAEDGTCAFNKSRAWVTVPYGSSNITSGDEMGIQAALLQTGPVSIAFQVTEDFHNYAGGIYVGKTCQSDAGHVNHAVLAVGYGVDPISHLDYWVVKNSWGTNWGEQGYFRIMKGVNMCGLAVCAASPNITGKAW